MHTKTLVMAAVFGALLAACDKAADPAAPASRSGSSATSGTSQPAPQSSTPTTPANLPKPTTAEKREGANPVQGQVDPKEPEQRRDFKQSGDAAGPTSEETQPRPSTGR